MRAFFLYICLIVLFAAVWVNSSDTPHHDTSMWFITVSSGFLYYNTVTCSFFKIQLILSFNENASERESDNNSNSNSKREKETPPVIWKM